MIPCHSLSFLSFFAVHSRLPRGLILETIAWWMETGSSISRVKDWVVPSLILYFMSSHVSSNLSDLNFILSIGVPL